MKKSLLIVLFSLFAAIQTQAQVFSIGPKFGVSQGDVRVTDGFQGEESKIGYHVGAFARINLPVIFLQPEVLYTNTGGSFRDNTFNYDVTFNRLDVPLMVGVNLGSLFRIQAGPVATYLLDSKISSSNTQQSTMIPPKEDFTFGYQAGVGVDIGTLIVDLKYEGGLTNSVSSYTQLPTDQRQNQLILSLGFRLF
ncbi:MAG: PorT family protein [Lunatimonas sp.]|uniref:porin family protein n=1 Tax=Lunatimonas sp. TaxID=2060141 RepID=UPI00263A7894|nr:porin family protein [Lunatimonas sp.]MCC5938361.1 PorT family protein [Lunatimonas sp.]